MAGKKNQDRPTHEPTPWELAQQAKKQSEASSSIWDRTKTIGQKLPKLKKQRQHVLVRRMIILISIFLIGILTITYLISPLGHVGVITVKGVKTVGEQNVINQSTVTSKDNFILTMVHRNNINKKILKGLPKIKIVEITASGINNLQFTVDEYKTIAYLTDDNQYFQILETGKVIHSTNQKPTSNYPIFMNFQAGKRLESMVSSFKKLSRTTQSRISEVKLMKDKVNPNKIHVYMNDGNEVIGDITTFAKKMVYYNTIAGNMKQKGVIDIEVGTYSYPFSDSSKENETSK